MSWDIFVQDIPKDAQTPADIPDDFKPKPLGKRAALIEKIRAVAPMADFSDPAWGTLDGPGFSIEVNLGDDDPVESFALHVRDGDQVPFLVAEILEHPGLRAFDMTSDSGMFTVPAEASKNQKKWAAYRTRVLKANRS